MSAPMTYLNPMRHCLNLTIRGEVFVRRILFEGSKAVGVEAESQGEVFTVTADRVILSAGAIRSPHILMLSGFGPGDNLEEFGIPQINDLPGVGQGLWNHLSAHVTFKVKDGVSLTADLEAPHFGLHYRSRGSDETNDMVLRTGNVVDERQGACSGPAHKIQDGGKSLPTGRRGYPALSAFPRVRGMFGSPLPTPASSRNSTTATSGTRTIFGVSERVLPTWSTTSRIRGVQRCGRSCNQSNRRPSDETPPPWITGYAQTVGTARHVSGTCRMGPDSDSMAVVDQYCRVKGVLGLWVADASVMPRIPRSGGIHPTVIMVAERAAEWISAG